MKNLLRVLVLIIPILFLIIYYSQRNSVLKNRQADCLDEVEIFQHNEVSYIRRLLMLSTQIQTSFFAERKITVSDSLDKIISIPELVNNKPKLILRFKESSCDICFSRQMKKLQENSDFFDSSNVVILVSFPNSKDLKILTKTYGLKFHVYNINATALKDFPFDKSPDPYFFLIDHTYNCTCFLYPDSDLPALTDNYLLLIKNRFGNAQ